MALDNKLFDDLARVAGGAVSLISTVRQQVQADLRGRVDGVANRMDLAARDEVERLQAQVAKFRSEQEDLKARIADLEAKVSGKKAAPKPATASKKKPTSKAKRK
jgi:BMFP domain-containing protein YqiC